MKKVAILLVFVLYINNCYSQSVQDTTISKKEYKELIENKEKVQYLSEQIENFQWILETKDILIDFFKQRIQSLEDQIEGYKKSKNKKCK